jgi:hypothetical protein
MGYGMQLTKTQDLIANLTGICVPSTTRSWRYGLELPSDPSQRETVILHSWSNHRLRVASTPSVVSCIMSHRFTPVCKGCTMGAIEKIERSLRDTDKKHPHSQNPKTPSSAMLERPWRPRPHTEIWRRTRNLFEAGLRFLQICRGTKRYMYQRVLRARTYVSWVCGPAKEYYIHDGEE